LGVSRDRIRDIGSIKYDPAETQINSTVPFQVLQIFRIDESRPILFGGSTHAGEEAILGEIYQRLRAQFPDLALIIAPRHVERVSEIRKRSRTLGLNVGLRSEAETGAIVTS
jgi:3-deoxy-D-manno-octulosonic-acid transferase